MYKEDLIKLAGFEDVIKGLAVAGGVGLAGYGAYKGIKALRRKMAQWATEASRRREEERKEYQKMSVANKKKKLIQDILDCWEEEHMSQGAEAGTLAGSGLGALVKGEDRDRYSNLGRGAGMLAAKLMAARNRLEMLQKLHSLPLDQLEILYKHMGRRCNLPTYILEKKSIFVEYK